MAFALLIIGVTLLVAAIRNTQGTLFGLLAGDFTGQNNFIFWGASILIIGAVGYIPKVKPISTAFMGLVILVLFLKKGQGFFPQFAAALGSAQAAPQSQPAASAAQPSGGLNPLPALPSLGTAITNAGGII